MNKLNFIYSMIIVLAFAPLLVGQQACTKSSMYSLPNVGQTSTLGVSGGSGSQPATTASAAPSVAGKGNSVTGVGAIICPTAQGIVTQIQNVLGVSIANGNTAAAYGQFISNLPATSDCTKAAGFDNAQIFIYAACSDLTTGGTPKAQSTYGVNLSGTIAANQTALVAAGMTMLNGFTAGIAGSSSATAGITAALTGLLTSTSPPATNTVAFMDVCIAAVTAGTLLISN